VQDLLVFAKVSNFDLKKVVLQCKASLIAASNEIQEVLVCTRFLKKIQPISVGV
jgi:hypothetical protein